jgi:hypothetical protein
LPTLVGPSKENKMRRAICTLVALLALVTSANAQTIAKEGKFEPETIKSELAAKYAAFNGRLEDQTVDLWDTYFLKSPNIGNMHEGRPEIGWETVHSGTIDFVESKPQGEMMMENLEFYPVSSNIAWVRGRMVIKVGGRVIEANFHDSLVKTVDGWRVILSVVTPERRSEDS